MRRFKNFGDLKRQTAKGKKPSDQDFLVKGRGKFSHFHRGFWIEEKRPGFFLCKFPNGHKVGLYAIDEEEVQTRIDDFLDKF